MDRRPEIGLDSYDRFFPNQDTLPKGGFGNLIALPLQKKPREKGNTLFLDEHLLPYPDQWAFLFTVSRMSLSDVEVLINVAIEKGQIIGVRVVITDEEDYEPWTAPPSRKMKDIPIACPLPKKIELVLANQIYIPKDQLPPPLKNRLIRIAAFQNPEFYKAQAMRFSTFNKSRIICCCEDFAKYIGIPRGCLEEVIELLTSLNIKTKITDERFQGIPINLTFHGSLRPEQDRAAQSILNHDTGVLSATTAFGKTVIAMYLIAKRAVNTLILVHRRQLLDQWIKNLCIFLGLNPKEIGQIGGGKNTLTGKIDVAIIQSLSKKGIVKDLVGEYGSLIVDECHHISARSFEIVARQCKARYVTGLSATVTRKDGHHPIIFMQCGPIRYRADELKQAAARPFSHKVIFRKTGFRLTCTLQQKTDIAIHEIYSALISNKKRNEIIVNDVIKAVKEKRSPIILTERKEHLLVLFDWLSQITLM